MKRNCCGSFIPCKKVSEVLDRFVILSVSSVHWIFTFSIKELEKEAKLVYVPSDSEAGTKPRSPERIHQLLLWDAAASCDCPLCIW